MLRLVWCIYAQSEEYAVAVERNSACVTLSPPVRRTERPDRVEVPFCRPAHAFRRQQHQRYFVMTARFHAEACHVSRRLSLDLALRHLQDRRPQLGPNGCAPHVRVDRVTVLSACSRYESSSAAPAGAVDAVITKRCLGDVVGVWRRRPRSRPLSPKSCYESDNVRGLDPTTRCAPSRWPPRSTQRAGRVS